MCNCHNHESFKSQLRKANSLSKEHGKKYVVWGLDFKTGNKVETKLFIGTATDAKKSGACCYTKPDGTEIEIPIKKAKKASSKVKEKES